VKRSRINPISKKRRLRSGIAGKLGIVRLFGKDMEALRLTAYLRSNGFCEMERDGSRCYEPVSYEYCELAHIRAKRNNGDSLDNVLISCRACHHRSHNPKVVPPKPLSEAR
jgi:hypothetical protein